MSNASPTTAAAPDRIRLPLDFDVEKLRQDTQAITNQDFVYYNVIMLRAPAFQVDPSIPMPPPAEDYADGSWTPWLNTKQLNAAPYLTSIVEQFQQHTDVTLVRLLRLAPGAEVKEHTDPTLGLEVHKSVVRLTIPIYNGQDVIFFLNNEPVPLQPGECWYLRLTDPHRIVNAGVTERINLTIDMVPNEWVRSMILGS